ncbi:HAD superfamily hydrolase [Nitzschia inconspicua]|uniref:HAD superfamily hydrolase n=1 Tax=Nitzschia inconspicua TaxID=303405 RepID=A0A9K3PG12_9STRA|nr:HAD superfamily hydrolase [Nitzschia inconspicua]
MRKQTRSVSAFLNSRPATVRYPFTPQSHLSVDVDSDEDAEQRLGENNFSTTTVVPNGTVNGDGERVPSRFDNLLKSVGLEGKLKNLDKLPPKTKLSVRDIFCNRELNLSQIKAIGFDMDYTLAQYKQPAFDQLAFDGAKEKLVHKLGYPEQVLDFQYDHERWTRGLIIDTERGNFLKIDRHKYVRLAYHGMEKIDSTTRKVLYSKNFNKVESFSEKSYVNMDTLFQFVDAQLFALLVDLKDHGDYDFLDFKTYGEIYRDIRQSVDLCHRDGVIKDEVARNPEQYLVLDEGMIPMLKRYKDDGVKLFLLTNSFWEYTSTAMNYLYHGKKVDEATQRKNDWLELFDLAIAGSCKPAFMLDPYLQLFRVNMEDGSLKNTDGVFEMNALPRGAEDFLKIGKIFQGGNWQHLHKMMGIRSGDEILYVGDHLYSDVLRSKRTLGWRSLFVMPELEGEIKTFSETIPLRKQIEDLRRLRGELGRVAEEIRRTKDTENPAVQKVLDEMEEDDSIIKSTLSPLVEQWHRSFHPIWGAMFNSGYQDSRFAFFVENYACLYTSRASNLGLVSTQKSFRTAMEMLPSDRLISDSVTWLDDSNPWIVESKET